MAGVWEMCGRWCQVVRGAVAGGVAGGVGGGVGV